MANKELISEIVDERAFAQLDKLAKQLDGVEKKLVNAANAALTANKAVYSSKGFAALQSTIEKSNKATLNLITSATRHQLLIAKLESEKQRFAHREEARNRKIEDSDKRRAKQEETSLKRQEAARKKLEAQLKREQSEYFKLDRELTKVRTRAQDVATQMLRLEQAGKQNTVEYDRLAKRFQNLSNITNRLDGSIKKIDATLGKHQRNVGNYASGWNGLSNSINQITREMPAFAVSAQTGFLAISNNLPILADEIKRIRLENAALAAEGKKGIPVMRQIAMSFLSWQTALSLGVTLLTLYGKEIVSWIGSLFKGKRAVDELKQSTENLNAAKLEGSKNAQREIVELDSYYRAATNANLPLKERKRAVDELQQQYPKYFKNLSDEEIMAGKAGAAYDRLAKSILAAAQARVYQDRIAENASKQLDNITEMVELQTKFNEAQNRFVQLSEKLSKMDPLGNSLGYENIMAQTQSAEAARNAIGRQIQEMGDANGMLERENQRYANQVQKLIAQNGIDVLSGTGGSGSKQDGLSNKRIEAQLALDQLRTQTIVENNQRIVDSDLHSYQERLNALEEFESTSKSLFEIEKQQALLGAELPEERAKAEEEYNNKIVELRRSLGAALWKITQDNLSEEDVWRQQAFQKRLDEINKSQNEELIALQSRFRDGTISQEQYEAERVRIQHKYLMDYIAEEIRAAEAAIVIAKSRGEDTAEAERRLAELKMKYSDEETKNYIKNNDKKKDSDEKIAELKKELMNAVFELGATIFNAEFERENQRIEREIENLDKQQERERRAIEVSASTQEERNQRIQALEKRTQAERERLEARQRQNQLRQARFEKAAAILQAVANTALGVSRAFADYPFPVSGVIAGLVGALGAVQIATIAAQPIPQYYKGTDSSQEGLAIVGERGPELMITPDGQLSITPDGDALAYLQKGTKIFTAHETKQILARQTLPHSESGSSDGPISTGINNLIARFDLLRKDIKTNAGRGTVLTKHGLINVTRDGTKWSNYLRRVIK